MGEYWTREAGGRQKQMSMCVCARALNLGSRARNIGKFDLLRKLNIARSENHNRLCLFHPNYSKNIICSMVLQYLSVLFQGCLPTDVPIKCSNTSNPIPSTYLRQYLQEFLHTAVSISCPIYRLSTPNITNLTPLPYLR